MKYLLLLSIFINSLFAIGQNNAPVAVDDTVYFENDYLRVNDSALIISDTFLINDTDPDGNSITIVSFQYFGTSIVNTFTNGNVITGAGYTMTYDFGGWDSIEYIIKDNGNPVMYDTGMLYMEVFKSSEVLNANNINAFINKEALFRTFHGEPGFKAPANQNMSSIFAANLWIGGASGSNRYLNIRQIGSSYNTTNCGPISTQTYVEHNDSKWDRVWKVYKDNVDFHISHWADPNYSLIQNIADWPAHGDTTIGEAFYLAPFFDNNLDGIYNPLMGDYPIIKGDQAIYFIYNEGMADLLYAPMMAEVHGMAYSFSCQDSALQNTIFVDYKIRNRSTISYTDTYVGLFSDIDLGDPYDDIAQCDVGRSLFYFVNGDSIDSSNGGYVGYGTHIPSQAAMLLKGPKQDDDGQDNAIGIGVNETVNGTGFGDGISDNEYWGLTGFMYFNSGQGLFTVPNTQFRMYGALKSEWKDGTHLVYGGYGHINGANSTAIPAAFAFPTNSDPNLYGTGGVVVTPWSAFDNYVDAGEKKGLSSSGPFTFNSGEYIELTYAFVFGRDYVNTGAQAGVTNMLERADSVRSYYDQGMLSACGFPLTVKSEIKTNTDFVVYPNPTLNVIHIEQHKAKNIKVEVIDATGKLVYTTTGHNKLTTIDLTRYTNGLYFIKVSSDEGFQVTKVIKK